MLPGELSAKAIAKSFWCYEVEKELQEIGLREEWMFNGWTCLRRQSLFGGREESENLPSRNIL